LGGVFRIEGERSTQVDTYIHDDDAEIREEIWNLRMIESISRRPPGNHSNLKQWYSIILHKLQLLFHHKTLLNRDPFPRLPFTLLHLRVIMPLAL